MTDFGPPAMLDGPLRFQLSRWSVQMYVGPMLLVNIKGKPLLL